MLVSNRLKFWSLALGIVLFGVGMVTFSMGLEVNQCDIACAETSWQTTQGTWQWDVIHGCAIVGALSLLFAAYRRFFRTGSPGAELALYAGALFVTVWLVALIAA